MSAFLRFLAALPALFKLFEALEKQIEADAKETGIKRKVADDVNTIHEAFNAKDPAKLNALFSSN